MARPCAPALTGPPAKAALREPVWSKPPVHAAKEIGVSDVALKKHCVKAGIDLPPAGYWIRRP